MAFSNGAPAVVSQVMTVVNNISENRNTTMRSDAREAITLAGKFPAIADKGTLRYDDDDELKYGTTRDIKPFLLTDLEKKYGADAAKVAKDMVDSFDTFLTDYFPTTYFDDAVTWITKTLTDGGTGINADIEKQLWDRERSRTLRDSRRAADEATAGWAARGFVIPPGALIHQLATLDLADQEKISESSRERAIKSWEVELENVRFAAEKAVDLRFAAITAAREHMNALAMAPKFGLELTQHTQATHERLNAALYEFHEKLRETRSWNYGNDKYNLERARAKDIQEKEWQVQSIKLIVDAVMAVVQSQGAQAAAALNGLHASAAISGSDITNISVLG